MKSLKSLKAFDVLKVLAALLMVLVLPLGVAHYFFYATIGTTPWDVGVSFKDLAQRCLPGLLVTAVLLGFLLLAMYSVVVLINLFLLPFFFARFQKAAWAAILAAMLSALLSSVLPRPFPSIGGWVLLAGVLAVLGLATCLISWRLLLSSVLVGAPLYALLATLTLLGLPVLQWLTSDLQRSQETGVPSLKGTMAALVCIPILILMLLILFLPLLFLVSRDEERTGQAWDLARSTVRKMSISNSVRFFLVTVLIAAYSAIGVGSYFAGKAVVAGYDIRWFDNRILNLIVSNTYGLSTSCVVLKRVGSYPTSLPTRALLLNSPKDSSYALLWGDGKVYHVPSVSIDLTELNNANRCF